MEDKKNTKRSKNYIQQPKTVPWSVLFSEEKIDKRFLEKLKKSKYEKDSLLVNLILLGDNNDFQDDDKIPNRDDFVEKSEIDSFIWL